MLFEFTEPERNTMRRALELYVAELRGEIVKTRSTSGGRPCVRKRRSSKAVSNS